MAGITDAVTITVRVSTNGYPRRQLPPRVVLDSLDGIRDKLEQQGYPGIDLAVIACTPQPEGEPIA